MKVVTINWKKIDKCSLQELTHYKYLTMECYFPFPAILLLGLV